MTSAPRPLTARAADDLRRGALHTLALYDPDACDMGVPAVAYDLAARVLAWLGEPTDGTNDAPPTQERR